MDSDGNTSLAVDVYDTARKAWVAGPELPGGPMKGFGCAAAVWEGRLYVSGMKGELYRLAAGGDGWEAAGQLAHPRIFHRLVPAGRAGLIALGGEDSESKRADLEFLPLRGPSEKDGVALLGSPTSHPLPNPQP